MTDSARSSGAELRETLDAAGELRARADRLRMVAQRLDDDAAMLEGDANSNGHQVIRGRQITERLLELTGPGEEIHYRELERLLSAAGYVPFGANPTNSLLAALQRSREFKSIGSRTGRYRRWKR